MAADHWYAVKCLLEHAGLSEDATAHVYEERIVLLRAVDFGDAVRRAEREATEYARPTSARYLGYSNAYKLDVESIGDATEVYSLMREVPLSPADFISRYYDDGTDKSRNVDPDRDPSD
jgi:hypothetical protein